jgi:hypothetical protein
LNPVKGITLEENAALAQGRTAMRLGLSADIREQTRRLRQAIAV